MQTAWQRGRLETSNRGQALRRARPSADAVLTPRPASGRVGGALRLLLLAAALVAGGTGVPRAAAEEPLAALRQWPQWRGPLATGEAPHAQPPLEWDGPSGKHVRWKATIPGDGTSTPVVWGDRVFVLAAVDTGRKAEQPVAEDPRAKTRPVENELEFTVLCYDRRDGKPLWKQIAAVAAPHEGHHPTHSYAAFSPVTDGKRLYVSFGSRGVYCYQLDGTPVWSRDFGKLRTRYGWGEAASPALWGEYLVVNWDQEDDSFLTVLDAATGETRWKKPRPGEPTSWATPLIVEHQGVPQVVVNGTGKARGYRLTDGEVLWECGGQTVNVIPCPVPAGEMVVCMSGYRGQAAYAIALGSRGELQPDSPGVRWQYHRGTPYVPSPLLVNQRLYFTRSNSAILTCLDVTSGEAVLADKRLSEISNIYASPVAANGHVYLVGRDGTTLVFRELAAGGAMEVVAVNRLDDPLDASPAIVGKQLFLRGRQTLYCISEE